MSVTPLVRLREALRAGDRHSSSAARYAVPVRWTGQGEGTIAVSPWAHYGAVIDAILGAAPAVREPRDPAAWTREAVIYNLFVRATTAFDHDGDGRLALPQNAGGWRETGSFLKSIALLPRLRAAGFNTLYLLPVTTIGSDGRKGSLGSPYAARNPYAIDPMLAEPALGLGAEAECAAFVDAAHRLGMRVLFEFVFRTAAKDSDWVARHPEWFYWIGEAVPDRPPGSADATAYGPPIFTDEELGRIHAAIDAGARADLVAPSAAHRGMFLPPPDASHVRAEQGAYRAELAGGRRGRVPGAFADWPPDDIQPPWGDVTYLRLYDHPAFNYLAYNTIRMYDARLAVPSQAVAPLWEEIAGIVPYHQRTFGIDGVMIDMGHALPPELKREIVRRAREIDASFAFWEENFTLTAASREEGYDAVTGYFWCDAHEVAKLRALLGRHASESLPLPYFAAPESHDSPRAAARPGGTAYARAVWAIACFLPALPFLHSGFELGERAPVNTGLGFTPAEAAAYPASVLALFNAVAYDWTTAEDLWPWIARLLALRRRHEAVILDPSPGTMALLDAGEEGILAFARGANGAGNCVVVAANFQRGAGPALTARLAGFAGTWTDELSGEVFVADGGSLELTLPPGGVRVLSRGGVGDRRSAHRRPSGSPEGPG